MLFSVLTIEYLLANVRDILIVYLLFQIIMNVNNGPKGYVYTLFNGPLQSFVNGIGVE